MKHPWVVTIICLLVLLCGLLGAGVYWLLATPSGARWIVGEVTRRTPFPVTVQQVEGTLSDTLFLTGIEVRNPELAVELEELGIKWQPMALLHGKIHFDELKAEGLTLKKTGLSTPSEPSTQPLQWPELPDWTGRVRAEISQFDLQRLVLKRPDQPAQSLERISGGIKWTGSRLVISSLTAEGPPGTLSASLEAAWRKPRLKLQASSRLKNVFGEGAAIDLDLDLRPEPRESKFSGNIHLQVATPATGKLELTGRLALDGESAGLQGFELRQVETEGLITGDLHVKQTDGSADVMADLKLVGIDLQQIVGQTTDLSGSLRLDGSIDDYQGQFQLRNQGEDWRTMQLASDFSGNQHEIFLKGLHGNLLQGRIRGEVMAAWQQELLVKGWLTGEELNPALYHPDWPGSLNLKMDGHWRRPESGPSEVAVQGYLLKSTLRDYELQGKIDGRLQGSQLEIKALELQGEGVFLTARGILQQRIDFQTRVKNLATLLPDASGSLQSSGWFRWKDGQLAGSAKGIARQLAYRDMEATEVTFSGQRLSAAGAGQLDLRLQGLKVAALPVMDAEVSASGTPEDHRVSAVVRPEQNASVELAVAGGYRQQQWSGLLQKLIYRDAGGPWQLQQPVRLTLSPESLNFEGLRMVGSGREELTANVALQLETLTGRARLQWQDLHLARLNPWLNESRLSGKTSGLAVLNRPSVNEPDLSVQVDLSGKVLQGDLQVDVQTAAANLSWNREGLRGNVTADLAEMGRFEGRLRSTEPAADKAFPERGEWSLAWNALDLQGLRTWLPEGINIEGQVAGQMQGQWGPQGVLTAQGNASISQGLVEAPAADTLISLPLEATKISWDWQDDRLAGQASLVLKDRGRLSGRFQVPLPTRWPLAINQTGELSAHLEGSVKEQGLVSALFPGMVRETRGSLNMDIDVSGVWQEPEVFGRLQLADAGVFVPAAGIELQDIGLEAELQKDQINLVRFSMDSGEGQIRGTGRIGLRQWQLGDYRINLEGERFELINLPELQALVNPQLVLKGSPEEVVITGKVTVPELLLRETKRADVLGPSEDVVIVGEVPREEKTPEMEVRGEIELILGDHVLVKMAGLDARLAGKATIRIAGTDDIRAFGRISIAEGAYRAYGAKLDIKRGNLLFSGGPIEQPTLDILALRTSGEVKAGVRVTGTPRAPVVDLYSDPAMGDADKLAYVVLGHPVARDGGEANLLMSAAGALLAQGESVVLQDQLKRQLGVDVLGFESGDGDIGESMLTIGKYLNPDLYVSIGQSLFQDSSEFRMRYRLGEHLEIESKTGTESGVDLYYKIEFR